MSVFFKKYMFHKAIGTQWKSVNKYRYVSTSYNAIPQAKRIVTDVERAEYEAMFPQIVKALTERYSNIPQATQRYAETLNSTVPNHPPSVGFFVINGFKAFQSNSNLTDHDSLRLAYLLGWCVDLLIGGYGIAHDLVKQSEFRSGKPSWYRNSEVGLHAVNDFMLVVHAPYVLLHRYFSKHQCYVPVVELFHKVYKLLSFSDSVEECFKAQGKTQLEAFTMKNYRTIAKYKQTIVLPITLSMHLSGAYDSKVHMEIENILRELGVYIMAKNDILDCYGEFGVTGQKRNDIPAGRFSWLLVKALQHATHEQKQIIRDHYGRAETGSELLIKNLYDQMQILDEFLIYEESCFNLLCGKIETSSKNIPRDYLYTVVKAIFGGLDYQCKLSQ